MTKLSHPLNLENEIFNKQGGTTKQEGWKNGLYKGEKACRWWNIWLAKHFSKLNKRGGGWCFPK